MLLKSLIFCAIVAGVLSGPTGPRGTTKCVSFCKDSTKFGYEPGTTYHYDYTTDVSTSVIGGSNDESRLHLTAQLDISAITNCELLLKLKNVRIEESDPDNVRSRRHLEGSEVLASELTRQPLRFSFQDGKIEHLCASEEESNWVLNVKRGILSTLQNTMDNFDKQTQQTHEIDVSGRCPTTYQPSENSWGGLTFVKTKDLSGCSQRHSHMTALQSIPYNSNSAMQNMPLLSGSQECSQVILNRRVEKVECREVHKFQPFDRADSGAKTVVSQSLVYTGEARRSPSSDETLRIVKTGLLYQEQGASNSIETDITEILSILNKLEDESVPEIRAEAPSHFIELVKRLRVINYTALRGLFTRVKSEVGRKQLLDAIPLVASGPALHFMRDLLFKGQLTDKQADAWLTSLSFIKNPSLDMIEAVKPLLKETPRNQAFLGISAMINSYCKNHQTDCVEDEPVRHVLDALFSHLGNDCRTSNLEQLRKIIFALKAIGNAGRFPVSAEEEDQSQSQRGQLVLERCFLDKSNPTEVRLAAIDAFRRMPCTAYQPTHIMSLYANMHEDTEVRVKSYLIAMKCANRQLINTIKDTLYTDSVNQVGSFVWTHLTNLQETSSPDKQAIRDLLSNDFLKNKFNTDARKYSRNYEGSIYREDLNAGASSDANVIFTPDSFLPRSAMLNLTVHLFGESLNVLELGGRVKALEQLLEPIFGPNGYFPDETVTEALHSVRRSKRDANNNEIERLSSIYNRAQSAQAKSNPMGSLYTRIFGHEIMYKNFDLVNENNEPSLVDEFGNDWLDMSQLIDALTTGKEVEYTKSSILLDATYTVTTGAGIPLSLGVQSAATVGLTANGKIDLTKFWENKEVDVQGHLRPSAAIQVDGIFSVQLGSSSSSASVRSGIRLENTLHTSTHLQGKILMKGSKLVHASVALPQDKQEIFKVSSSLLLLRPSKKDHVIEQGPRGVPKSHSKTCIPSSSSALSRALGVEICGEWSLPQDLTFPLRTPAHAALYLQKTDTFTAYEFDWRFNNEGNHGQDLDVSILFDTPGSRVNRRLSADLHWDSNNGKMEASVNSPSTALALEGRYSKLAKVLQLSVLSGRDEILLVKLGLNQQLDGSRMEPELLIKLFNRPLLALEGSVDVMQMRNENGKASLNLVLSHVTQTPIRLTGEVSKAGEKFDTKVGIESQIVNGNARSQLRVKQGLFSVKSVTEYSWRNSETQSVDISAKVQSSKKGTLGRFSTQFSFTMLDAPENSFEFSWDTKKSIGYLENNLIARLGKSSWEGQTLYNNQVTRESQDLTLKVTFLAPRQEIDYHVELTHKLNNLGMTTKFVGRTNPQNEVRAEIDFADESNNNNGLIKKALSAKVNWPQTEYSIRSHLREVRDGEFEGEFIFLPHQSPEMKASLIYINKSNVKKLEHSAEFRARGFTASPFFGSAAFAASDRQSSLNGQLVIEGNEEYSGKWSASLDYGVAKNTKKLTGKLNLNERNYNGEVTLKKTKQGDRVLNVDLKGTRHVAIDATLRGDLPGPLALTFNFYPAKDQSPQSKVRFTGTFDPRSVNFQVNYFDQVLSGAGSYSETSLQLETIWEGQKWALALEAPHTNLYKFVVSAKLETPIDGLRDLSYAVEHTMSRNGKEINSQLQGSLDGYQGSMTLAATLMTNHECKILTSAQFTGMERLEGYVRLGHSKMEKSIQITGKVGEREKTIKASVNYVNHGFKANFDFTGCGSIPQIKAELGHQNENSLITNLIIDWTPRRQQRQRVQLELSGSRHPLTYKFILTTPISSLEKLEGQFSLKNENDNRAIELTLNAPSCPIMPLTLSSNVVGSRANFRHETTVSWTERRRIQTVKLTAEGRFNSLLDSVVNTKLTIPHNNYQLSWSAQGQGHNGKQIQVDATIDDKRHSAGLNWNLASSTQLQAGIWADLHKQPRMSLDLEHVRKSGDFKVVIKASRGTEQLLDLMTHLRSSGLDRWDFSALIDSSMVEILPKIQVTSVHKMERRGELQINHSTQIEVKRLNKVLALLNLNNDYDSDESQDVNRMSVEFNLKNGQQFDGSVMHNQHKVEVKGELEKVRNGRKLQLDISSSFFSPVEIRGEMKNEGRDGYEASLTANKNGQNLFAIKAGAGQKNGRMSGNVEVDCSFGHHVTASIVLNNQHNSLEVILKEDRAGLIDLVFSAQAKPNKGFIKVDIKSELFNILENKVQLAAEYQLENSAIEVSAKYLNNGEEKSISGMGQWTEEKKGVEVIFKGEDSGSFIVTLSGYSDLRTSLIVNGEPVFKFSMIHAMAQGEYLSGTHTIKIKGQTKYSPEVYEVITTFGLDWNKLLFRTVTPIEGWKDVSLTGQFQLDSSSPTKSVQLVAQKEGEKYILNAQVRLSTHHHTLTYLVEKLMITVKTPIENWTNMEFDLELLTRERYGGNLEVVLENQKIVVKGYVSAKDVNMLIETPGDLVRRATVQGQWSLDPAHQKKDVSLKASLNQDAYQLDAQWELEKTHGSAVLSVDGSEITKYDLQLTYDLRQDYEAHVQLKTGSDSEKTHKIGGRVALTHSGFSINAVTPLSGFEQISGKVQHQQKSQGHHAAKVNFELNGQPALKLDTEVKSNHEQGQVQVKADVSAPVFDIEETSLTLALKYQPEGHQKIFSIQGQLNGQTIDASLSINKDDKLVNWRHGTNAAIILDIETPIDHLRKIKFNLNYDRSVKGQSENSEKLHTLSFSAQKDEQVISGKVNLQHQLDLRRNIFNVEVAGDFAAPSFDIEKIEAAGKIQANGASHQNVPATLLLEAEYNGQKHRIEGAFTASSHSFNLQLGTSFELFHTLQLSADLHSNGQYESRLLFNDQEFKVKGRYVFNGLSLTQVTVDLETPIDQFEKVKSNLEVKIAGGQLLAALTFQNQKFRYGAKLEGVYDHHRKHGYLPSSADLKLTLSTPVSGYEQVAYTMSYATPSQLRFTLQRNGKEELLGEFELTSGEVKANLISSFKHMKNIESRNKITWSLAPLTVSVHLELGPSDYSASLKTDIGNDLKTGLLTFHTSMLPGVMENLKIDWTVEGGLEGGNAVGNFQLDGLHKSVKSSWKNEGGDWEAAKFEIYLNPTEKSGSRNHQSENVNGLTAHYNFAQGGNGKLAASLMYTWQGMKQQFTFSSSVKRHTAASTLDISIQTPFDLIRDAAINGKLTSGQSGHNLDLTAKLNEETLVNTNALLSFDTMASKLKWTFNAPMVCQPFTLMAAYDLIQEAKFMELTYTQDQYQINVRADAAVPSDSENSNEIELRMQVNSNVPLIEVSVSGSLKAGYKIDRDDTRHISVSVNSETTGKWEVNSALRLNPTDFLARFRLHSPQPEVIPSIKVEMDHRGNYRQGISSQISLQMDKYPEIAGSLSVTMDKILITFKSGIPNFENMSLEAKIEDGSNNGNGRSTDFAHKMFVVEINAMGGKVKLEGKIRIPSNNSIAARGNLRLTSTWDKLTSGELHLNVGDDGMVNINGKWGEQNVVLRGQIDIRNNNSNNHRSGRRGSRHAGQWWANAATEFVLEANNEEKFKIKTSHLMSADQYSFNVTLADQYTLKTLVQTNGQKIFYSTVQWAEDQKVRALAEAGNGRFMATIETPWTPEIRTNGVYTAIPGEELSAKGHFFYDGQKSSLEARATTSKGSFHSSMNVDIPALYQKLDAQMNVKKLGEGAFDGQVDLKMGDRALAIRGLLSTLEKPQNGRRVVERTVKLTFSLPSESYPDISAELTVLRSKSGFSVLHVEGSLTLPSSGVSKAAFGYEVPIHNAKQLGIRTMIDTPLIPTNGPVEFIISTEILAARNFKVRVQYENNDVQLAWNTDLPTLKIEAVADLPAIYPRHTPFRFSIDGSLNVDDQRSKGQKSVILNVSGGCSQHSVNIQTVYTRIGGNVEARFLVNAPTLLHKPYEVMLKLDLGWSRPKYVIELEATRGKVSDGQTISWTGEATITPDDLAFAGKMSGILGDHQLALEAKQVGQIWEVTVNGESPQLLSGKKFNVLTKFRLIDQNDNKGLEIDMECRTRKAVHSGRMVLTLDAERGQISADLQSPSFKKPVAINVNWNVDRKEMGVRTSVIADILGERHALEGSVNVQDLAARLNVQSRFVPGNEFNVQSKIVVRDQDVELLADAKVNEQQWRLEATGKYNNARDLESKLEVRTPFQNMERFTIGGKIRANEIHAEIYTPFKDFPNAIFTLSGVPIFEPFALRNIQPLIVVGLPWVTYKGAAICNLPQRGRPGKFEISFEKTNPKQQRKNQQEQGKVFQATLQVPSLDDLHTQMTTPAKIRFDAVLPSYLSGSRRATRVQWELTGRLQWKTWAELSAFAELNDQKLELTSTIVNERGNRRLAVNLNTPFANFQNLVASVRLEDYHEGHSIIAEFQHPSWSTPARLEVDYRYKFNGFTDMYGELTIGSPLESPLNIKAESKVHSGGVYKGQLSGSWAEQRPSLTLEAGISDDHVYTIFEAVVDPTQPDFHTKVRFEVIRGQSSDFSGQFLVEYERAELFNIQLLFNNKEELLDAQFLIKTPFALLKSASAGLRLSPLNWRKESLTLEKIVNNLDMNLNLIYNQKKIIQLELVNMNGRRSLEIHNPLRPIALALTYERVPGQKLRVVSEVCWDTRRAGESTVGLEFLISRPTTTSAARLGSIKISAGGMGSYQVVLSHLLTAVKLEQSLRIRVQPPMSSELHEVGYSVQLNDLSAHSSSRSGRKYELLTTIETPFRAIQLEAATVDSSQQIYRFVQLKWDAKRDPTKKVGFKYNSEKVNAWKSQSVKTILTLVHPSLTHDVTLYMEKAMANEMIKTLEVALQVTAYPQDKFSMTFANPKQDGQFIMVISHPASNFNVQLLGKKQTDDSPATLAISYLDTQGQTHMLQAVYQIDEATRSGLFELSAGSGVGTTTVQQQQLQSLIRAQVVQEVNLVIVNFRMMEKQMNVNVYKDRKYMDLVIEHEHDRKFFLTAGLPHNKEVSLKVWREEYGMNVQDVLAAVRLNTSHILSTKINWRPELYQELEDIFIDFSLDNNYPCISSMVSSMTRKVQQEVVGRWENLQPGVQIALAELGRFTFEQVTTLAEEALVIVRWFQNVYDSNFLYVKDIGQVVGRSVEGVFFVGADILSNMSSVISDILRIIGETTEQIIDVSRNLAGNLEKEVGQLWDQLEDWVEHIWRHNFRFLSDFFDFVEDVYETLVEIVEGKLDILEKKIMGVGFIRSAVLLYQDYASWIEELPLQDFVDKARVYLDELIWQRLRVYYLPYYDALMVAVEEKNLLAILELPPFPYLRHISLKVNMAVSRFIGFIEAEQTIKLLVTKALHYLDNVVRRHVPTYTLIWDTQKGAIEYHQPLTFLQWDDFHSLPTLRGSADDQEDVNKMSELYYKIMDTMSNVKPAWDMNLRDILPPFGAHAVMAGDYHYYTFDKQYFRFAGECSYVLAADLLHNNFSLIVNYENSPSDSLIAVRKRSYSLISGNNNVEIDPSNLKVTLDGRKTELPLEVGPTFIRRLPNTLEIFDSRGFQMTCSQSPAVCTVSVSGWYFGKIAGLLGSYDNEQMNDMRTPEGQIVQDVAAFAHSWRVGRQSGECRMKNLARADNNNNNEMIDNNDNVCSKHFDEKNSLLRPCFDRVDVTPFRDMCRFDTSRNVNKAGRQESACTAISAYVAECQKSGVDVWLPPVCVHCKLEDGTTLMSGENATLEANGEVRPPKSSDVVILLEESSCLSTQGLTDLIRKLDTTMRNQGGLTNNRFALVGYGGQGPHRNPHIRTSAGQVWAHSTLFKISENLEMNGEGQGDLYRAIEFAAGTLKFRAGVSKTLIAITCGDEQCGSERHYPDTLTLLLENDMKLHMLTPKDFSFKGNKKDAGSSKMFGIDRQGVFHTAHIRDTNLDADRSLKRQINLPKDLCTPLAIETNGTRFTLQKSSKKFIDVWTRRVTQTAQPSPCQHCECIPDKSGSPHVVCAQCVSPNLQRMLLEWEKYQAIEGLQDETIQFESIQNQNYE